MKLVLRDRNPTVVAAWRLAFTDMPVAVSQGDIFDAFPTDAVVSPANSLGQMNGGIDLAYTRRWPTIQRHVFAMINHHCGRLLIGECDAVYTGDRHCLWLLVAPTMLTPGPVPNTANAFLAMRAALNKAKQMNLQSVVSPGLCTWSGEMDPSLSAWQMRAAWEFCHKT